MKTIKVSDEVYDYLKGMIDDEHVANSDDSEERNANGETVAHRPSFSEIISHLIEDRETEPRSWQITEERKAAIDRGLQFLEWSYAKNSALDTKEQITVLWAMLDEAGQ